MRLKRIAHDRGEAIAVQAIERDKLDANRAIAPMQIPKNAITIDSTDLTPEEVVQQILELVPPQT